MNVETIPAYLHYKMTFMCLSKSEAFVYECGLIIPSARPISPFA